MSLNTISWPPLARPTNTPYGMGLRYYHPTKVGKYEIWPWQLILPTNIPNWQVWNFVY